MLLDQSGIGQQIDGTLKQMECIIAGSRDTEREPLIAAGGIANKVRTDASEVGIAGLACVIKSLLKKANQLCKKYI
ncbi:MAG: hypothetical protein Q4F17_08770 [Eubacteriales bacterium]|nr:hypothetical protein [Eubacteriales bacterium]